MSPKLQPDDGGAVACEEARIKRTTLRFYSAACEQRYRTEKAIAMTRPARALFSAISVIASLYVGYSFSFSGEFAKIRIAYVALALVLAASAMGLSYSERLRAWCVEFTAGVFGSMFMIFWWVVIVSSEQWRLEAAVKSARNATCVAEGALDFSPEEWVILCQNAYHGMVVLMHSVSVTLALGICLILGMPFWPAALTTGLPTTAHLLHIVASVSANKEDIPDLGAIPLYFGLFLYLPAMALLLCVPWRLEYKERLAFARGVRVEDMIKAKDNKIIAQTRRISVAKKRLRDQHSKIVKLESKHLPSNAEQTLFEPFRERLQKSIGTHFLRPEEFETIHVLGKGAYGEVSLATWKTRWNDKPLAVATKSLHPHLLKTKRELEKLASEIEMLDKLKHKNIVRFMGVAWSENAFPFIVMEFVPGGTVADLLYGGAGDEDAEGEEGGDSLTLCTWGDPLLKVASDLCKGLIYLHALEVLHRDLKPANLLLTRTYGAKIGDLGEARDLGDETMTLVGTPWYMAPEIYIGDGHYDKSADIYSFGIIINEFDTKSKPYSQPCSVDDVELTKPTLSDTAETVKSDPFTPPPLSKATSFLALQR